MQAKDCVECFVSGESMCSLSQKGARWMPHVCVRSPLCLLSVFGNLLVVVS